MKVTVLLSYEKNVYFILDKHFQAAARSNSVPKLAELNLYFLLLFFFSNISRTHEVNNNSWLCIFMFLAYVVMGIEIVCLKYMSNALRLFVFLISFGMRAIWIYCLFIMPMYTLSENIYCASSIPLRFLVSRI